MAARRLVVTALLWAVITLGFSAVKAEPRGACIEISPDALVGTTFGYSVTLGEGNATVHKSDVHFWDGPLVFCIPPKGMPALWMPSEAWPQFASGGADSHSRLSPGSITPASLFPATSAAAPSILPAHQKLASDAWIDSSKNKKGERCCDAGKDCYSLGPERVKPASGGVTVTMDDGQTIFIPGDQIMASEDGKYWVCYWGGQIKCFFAPYSGS
jgi:hypothetical protein